jgi:lipid-binding SYLF domain-containing protein
MRLKIIFSIVVVSLLATSFAMAADDNAKDREKIEKMAAQTLQDLYKLEPASKAAVQKAAGYAVFNNTGANILVLSTARGAGIATNTKTKQETFMKMISAGAGLGLGVKDYRVIFVFEKSRLVVPADPSHGLKQSVSVRNTN